MRKFFCRTTSGDLSLVQNPEPVREFPGPRRIVSDNNKRHFPFLFQSRQQFVNFGSRDTIEPAAGLINESVLLNSNFAPQEPNVSIFYRAPAHVIMTASRKSEESHTSAKRAY